MTALVINNYLEKGTKSIKEQTFHIELNLEIGISFHSEPY